jgi:ABC-type branched-subunit amino acid transport system substrate-binding protein
MKRQSRWIMLVFVAVAFPLIFSASAPAKEKFGIAFLGDLTGPLGFWNAPRLVGIQDAMEYINQNQDGIAGREIYLDWVDSQSKIDMATSGYERLKAKGYLVWHTCGTGEQQMLKARYEDDRSQVLYTCSASPGVMYPPGYVFGTDAYFPDKWGLFVDWLVQNWDFKKMGRKPRIAVLTYPSGLGKAILAEEFLNYAKEKGVEIVETVFIPFVTVDAATPLMKAKKAGADWCIGMWLYQTVPPYLNENYKQKLGLKFAITLVEDVVVANANPKEAAIGLVGLSNWTMTWEDTEGIKIIRQTWEKKNRRPEDRGASYILGWMNTWQTKMVVEQTLKKVGKWEKVTAAEIRKTTESWGKFDIMGLGRVDYGKNKRGVGIQRVCEVKKVKVGGQDVIRWEYASDWMSAPHLVPQKWQEPLPY